MKYLITISILFFAACGSSPGQTLDDCLHKWDIAPKNWTIFNESSLG